MTRSTESSFTIDKPTNSLRTNPLAASTSASEAMERPSKKQKSPEALVTFIIGPGGNPTTYLIHKEYACTSPVLNAAFNSQFIEGQTQTYKLEDTTSRAFRFFSQWLYSGSLTLWSRQCGLTRTAMQAMTPPYYESDLSKGLYRIELLALLEAWVLADKPVMPELQTYIIGAMTILIDHFGLIASVSFCLDYVYSNTCDGSPLRRYFVDLMVFSSALLSEAFPPVSEKNAEDFPHQMLIDMFLRQGKGVK